MSAFENLSKLYDIIRPVLDVGIMTFIIYKAYEIIIKTMLEEGER